MEDDFILSERIEYKNGYEGFLVTKVNSENSQISEEARKMYPEMLIIYKGKVQRIIPSGILVAIPGYKLLAYVPKYHIKNYDFKVIEDEIELDQEVYVKITRIDYSNHRYQGSMKYCDQEKGVDLDPNNVKWSVEFKTSNTKEDDKKNKINLDAIYNTVCEKCGKKGHIKAECYSYGKSYELIPENMNLLEKKINNEKLYNQNLQLLIEDKKKRKKEKKKSKKIKKEKKNKKEKKKKSSKYKDN